MKEIIYELTYLISGQLDETQAQELAKKIEKKLQESSVVLTSIEPKKIKLAYIIKKQQDGYLVSVDFTADPKFILLLSKEMEKEADVLRFLTIKKSPEKQKEEKPASAPTELERGKEEVIGKPETPETPAEPAVKEKKKTKKPASAEAIADKEEDLKKIEEDLDEILGQ
jgi:ribosomal protein S6